VSFADEEEFNSFVGRDHILPHVTPEAVAKSMGGFSLQLGKNRDMACRLGSVPRHDPKVDSPKLNLFFASPLGWRAKVQHVDENDRDYVLGYLPNWKR